MVTGSVAKALRIAESSRLADVAREAEAKVLEVVEAMNHAREEAQRPKQRMRDRHGVEVRISDGDEHTRVYLGLHIYVRERI